eukprot:COSAG01_NODE_3256_length_6345_cov_15.186359_2_plen_52_part_00
MRGCSMQRAHACMESILAESSSVKNVWWRGRPFRMMMMMKKKKKKKKKRGV